MRKSISIWSIKSKNVIKKKDTYVDVRLDIIITHGKQPRVRWEVLACKTTLSSIQIFIEVIVTSQNNGSVIGFYNHIFFRKKTPNN